MKKYINISEVEGFTPTDKEYNKICVETFYFKGTGLVAVFQEGKHEDEGRGFNSFSFDLFGSKKARVLILGMIRKNQKKIDQATKEFFEKHNNQELINIFNTYKK